MSAQHSCQVRSTGGLRRLFAGIARRYEHKHASREPVIDLQVPHHLL
jgi:hypothetical protein